MVPVYEKTRGDKLFVLVFRWLIPLLLFVLFTRLFYMQISVPNVYISDIKSHIRIAENGRGYSLLYRVMQLIILIVDKQYRGISIALLEGLMTILTIYPTAGWIRKRYQIQTWLSFLAAECLLFFSSIYLPVIQPYFYKWGIVTQPWHNITYIGMRLFAMLTMYFFSDVLDVYQQKITMGNWISIALPLAIATGIKPSFLLAFSWALLVFLIIDAIKGKLNRRVIMQCIKMGTTVFPALIIMYFQSKLLYTGGGEGSTGIGLALTSSRFFSAGLWATSIKLARGILLALVVMISTIHKDNRKASQYGYVIYLIALLQVIVFFETGRRAKDGNFYWTLYICGYILYTQVIARWIYSLLHMKFDNIKQKSYIVVTTMLVIGHIISGICYYIMIMCGSQYAI